MRKNVVRLFTLALVFVMICMLVPGGFLPGVSPAGLSPSSGLPISDDILPGASGAGNGGADTYVPYEVLAPADSMDHAQQIAEAYSLELDSYAYGIAVLIAPNPERAVEISEQMQEEGIPPLSLNLLYQTSEATVSTHDEADAAGEDAPERDTSVENVPEYGASAVATPYGTFTQKYVPGSAEELYKFYGILPDDLSVQAALQSEDSPTADAADEGETTLQWQHDEMNTELAWGKNATGAGVVVAVIDTGIDVDHPVFAGKISQESYNSHTNEVGPEYVDDVHGHGTHVSGIAAGPRVSAVPVYDAEGGGSGYQYTEEETEEGLAWLSGIAPDAQILTIKADMPSAPGLFNEAALLRGINYAVEHGANVINMSLGRQGDPSWLERKTIANAVAAGVVVICAAGNESTRVGYPAAYPEAMAVSAIMPGSIFDYSYSNYGADVDVAAPGSSIYSTVMGGGFEAWDGTSMASPTVAGVAALLLEQNPGYRPGDVRNILCQTARDAGDMGRDDYYGDGIVNAYAAVLGPDALLNVTYDFNDGVRDAVTVKVAPGNKLIEPPYPQGEEYVFDGWRVRETGQTFDFNEPVTDNIVLEAQWIEARQGMYAAAFPDLNLLREVLRLMNQDGNIRTPSYILDASEKAALAEIQSLDVPNRKIKDMTGLQYFSGLESLYCPGNQLTELDTSKNPLLQALSCSDNRISQLDVSKNPLLQGLWCQVNDLTQLDVAQNGALEFFNCGENPLTELDVSHNPLLSVFGCYLCQLPELDISGNPALQNFICEGNQLVELDVSGNPALTELWCDYNQLTDLDVSSCPELVFLNCAVNQLTELDVTANAKLTTLVCEFSRSLRTVDVSGSPALAEFWAFSSGLTALDFSNNPELQTVICSYNNLQTLDIGNCTKLQIVQCDNNGIGMLDISNHPELISLICMSNRLNTLDVSHCTSLEDLHCGNNQLTELSLPNSSALLSLGCGYNDLTALDVSGCAGLKSISCGDNQLTELDVSNNTALLELYCESNALSELDLSANTALESLYCPYNRLTTLEASGKTRLTNLDCGSNMLNDLDVTGDNALVHLDCSWNNMGWIYDVSGWQEIGLILEKTFFYYPQNALQKPSITITSQPEAAITVLQGDPTSSLTVAAAFSEELQYQWYSGNMADKNIGGELIEGATDPTFMIPVTQEVGFHYFYCVISTQAEGIPSITSNVACVEVVAEWLDNMYCVEFPDPAFRTEVLWMLNEIDGGDRTGGSAVTPGDVELLAMFSYLYLQGENIRDMTGLTYFTGLEELDCSNNLLTELNVSNSTSLKVLQCTNNQLTSLDLSQNPQLEVLCCYENQLTSLDVSENPDLVELFCGNNQLTEMEVKSNTGLEQLACYGNQLSVLEVADNINLEWLDCGFNQLTVLDVSSNINLKNLSCGYNQLTVLDVSNNTALESLDCSYNQLTELDAKACTELTNLSCRGNPCTIIEYSIVGQPCLVVANGNGYVGVVAYEYYDGIYSQISAWPGEGSRFIDWTVDGEKIAGDEEYGWINYSFASATGYDAIANFDPAGTMVLRSLSVSSLPAKTAYIVGETLDLTGLAVTAIYSDGSRNAVTGYTTSLADGALLDAMGSQTVMVSYTEGDVTKTASFTVAVESKPVVTATLESIAVSGGPAKTAYTVGETLDITGLVITAAYSDGSSNTVTEYTTSPADGALLDEAGTQTVVVTYTEDDETRTASFTVAVENTSVVPGTLESIAVSSNPAKTAYTVGEALDLAGLVITAAYSDGSSNTVTEYTTSPADGAMLDTVDTQTVVVTYTEGDETRTANFTVEVESAPVVPVVLTSIAVSNTPAKTAYVVGETLDLTGLVVTAIYSDGSRNVVSDYTSSLLDGAVLETAGAQIIAISYTEGDATATASFTVAVESEPVVPVLDSITVSSVPVKTTYTAGEALDLAGLVITAAYSNGSSSTVTGYTTNPADGTLLGAVGTQTVVVNYTEGDVTAAAVSFTVTVAAAPVVLESIAVGGMPSKTAYTVGEALDLSGLIIVASYSDGSSSVVAGYTTSPANGTRLGTAGTQTVAVNYTEGGVAKTASFTLTVAAPAKAQTPSSTQAPAPTQTPAAGAAGGSRPAATRPAGAATAPKPASTVSGNSSEATVVSSAPEQSASSQVISEDISNREVPLQSPAQISQGGFPWWGIVIGVSVLAGLIAVVCVLAARRKQQQ